MFVFAFNIKILMMFLIVKLYAFSSVADNSGYERIHAMHGVEYGSVSSRYI